jgi:hypothetical protein
MPFRPLTLFVIACCLPIAAGCSAGPTAAKPGQVAASRPPFDATSYAARYVNLCMKDGGTQGRCQCEVDDIGSRMGQDGLARIVKQMEAGGSEALLAYQARQPAMTACGWPNTKL